METQAYLSTSGETTLVVLEGQKVRNFPLDAKSRWSIGRAVPNNSPDIPLESVIAGRAHGQFVNMEQTWFYVDQGSVNGTYLNGNKIPNKRRETSALQKLASGDILQIDAENLEYPDERGVWLYFTTEPLGGEWKSYPLNPERETTIGRDAETCDLTVPLPYISGQHVKIGFANGHYFIMDCGSTAGTWLNGEKLEKGTVLKEKDRIAICDCLFIFTGRELLYTIGGGKHAAEQESGRIILRADIETKKVPNNSGPGEKELIRDVHVEVREGSLVALLGSSGAGKTTVMNCMNGMDAKGVKGEVYFKGVDLLKHFDRMKQLIGSVPQEEVFHPMLKVEDELKAAAVIRLPGDTKRKEIQAHVDDTIRKLNLTAVRKNKISKCSGGEKKRVNIAIELVADRQLLCLDEPDAGLDPGMKRELFGILKDLAHNEGKSILVIIHDVSDIHLFDQIIMMTKLDNVGRLAFSGTPEEAKAYFGVEIKEAYDLLNQYPERYVKGTKRDE